MADKKKPETPKNPLAAELEAAMRNEQEAEQGAEDALGSIAESLALIQCHLCALVYLERTKNTEKTGLTYIPEVFNAIYDGTDPFAPENMPKAVEPENVAASA